ncbi:hypothetical protein ACFRH6_28505 [Streptomyces sp. NPDC056749]|uniref:hypothetical protein n=1 Tax=Streptomyces sp. NPDC056749 TaxID=3345936 RepID=UPI0036AD37BA
MTPDRGEGDGAFERHPPFDADTPIRYDTFISYSWADAEAHARALDDALRNLARPADGIRALEVFLDRAGMRVTPAIWLEMAGHLDASRHFTLVASPAATYDPGSYLAREVDRRRGTRGTDELTIVLVKGRATWDEGCRDFDYDADDNAVPPGLRGAFTTRPHIIDLTSLDAGTELNLSHAPFHDACVELAARVHGEDARTLRARDLGERNRERRRRRRMRSASGLTVTALVSVGLVLAAAAVYSGVQRELAQDAGRKAVERAAQARADGLAVRAANTAAPDLRLLLAAQAVSTAATEEAVPVLRAAVSDDVVAYLHPGAGPVHDVALSANGAHVGATDDKGDVRAWDTATRRPLFGPLHLGAYAVEWSDDGTLLMAAGRDGTVSFLRASGLDERKPGRRDGAAAGGAVALSADATRFALAPPGGPVTVWDRAGATPVTVLSGTTGPVRLSFVTPDSLVVGSDLVTLPGGGTHAVPPTTGPVCSQLVQDVHGPVAYDAGYGSFVFAEEHDLFVQAHRPENGGMPEAPEFRCASGEEKLNLTLSGAATAVDIASTGLTAAGTGQGLVVLARPDRPALSPEADVEKLVDAACAKAGRVLTPKEWQAALPGRPYAPACRSAP